MNHRKFLQTFLGIALIIVVMSGCSSATPTPTVTPTREPATPTTEPTNQYSDEHAEIILDKTERMQELPEDLSGRIAEQGKEFIDFIFL